MLPTSFQVPAALLFVIGGLLACFVGHRIFRLVLAITGFILGVLLAGGVLVPEATGTKAALVMLAGGAAGAVLFVLAEFVGVALVGAGVAAMAVHFGAAAFGREPQALLVLACTVAGALVALAVQRYVIVLGTAFGGAWLLLVGALALWQQQAVMAVIRRAPDWFVHPLRPAVGYEWVILLWFAVGLLGTLIQLGLAQVIPRPRGAGDVAR